MGYDLFFVPLGKDPNLRASIPIERVRQAFEHFKIELPDLIEGSNSTFIQSQEGAPHLINEDITFEVKNGEIAGLSIYRPCSPMPGARHFWHALLELGFVMFLPFDGSAFATAEVTQEATYLLKSSGGVRVVARPEEIVF